MQNNDSIKKPSLKLDLVGPTVDDDVRRIIARYGPEAVKQAVKSQTKTRRGRPEEADLKLLKPYFEEDARIWLEGVDPIAIRSNYSIAKKISEDFRGQSSQATHRRIMNKLKQIRKQQILLSALYQSMDEYPFSIYLKALEELSDLAEKRKHDSPWKQMRKIALQHIEDYKRKVGDPKPELSISEIEKATRDALLDLADFPRIHHRGGIFGRLKT